VREFTPEIWRISGNARLVMVAVGETVGGNAVGSSVLLHFIGADCVGPGRVYPKDLGADRRGDLGVAVLRASFGRNLESAKRLDLVLGRSLPDGVGAPDYVVLTRILKDLSYVIGRAI